MWKVLIKLVEKWACCHEWTTHQIAKTYEIFYDKKPSKIEETLICKKCGKIKKIKI